MSTYGPYSPIRQAGSIYFISGQVGIDPKNNKAGPSIKQQTSQTLVNLKTTLSQRDLQLDHVIKTTIFLKNMEDFYAMNKIYETFFTEPRPARSCVEVAGLPKLADNELLVEIEAVAHKP